MARLIGNYHITSCPANTIRRKIPPTAPAPTTRIRIIAP